MATKIVLVIKTDVSCFDYMCAYREYVLIMFIQVEVKVITQVAVENVEIGVGDKDQSTATKTTK